MMLVSKKNQRKMNALFICILWDLNAKDEIVTLRMYSWQPPAGRKAKCWKFVLAVSFCSMQIHVTFFQWWLLTPFCTSLLSDFGEIASLLTEMQFHLCSWVFFFLIYFIKSLWIWRQCIEGNWQPDQFIECAECSTNAGCRPYFHYCNFNSCYFYYLFLDLLS